MRPRLPRAGARHSERGYIAVTTGLILIVLMSFCAFAVDVGNWYLTGQRAQRAADAAALAGVVKLPGNQDAAMSMAKTYSANNGFKDGTASTKVTGALSGGPTRLRVEVTRTVDNIFGSLLGRPKTTISRYAVADYAGPVPLGSPCNRFGDDPDPGATGSANCNNTGQFWANIGSPAAQKDRGDAFQNNICAAGVDGCVGGTINSDYDVRGYVYTVTLKQAVNGLKIDLFDPAMIAVGDYCDLATAHLADAAALPANKTAVSNPAERYAPNPGPYCTGDAQQGTTGTGQVPTQFKVFAPGANQWDPLTWPEVAGCTKTYPAFKGDLSKALNKTNAKYSAVVAANFRRWVNLCEVKGAIQPGTYAIQVKTSGLNADLEGGHNRFGIRAYGTGAADNDNISIAGFGKMGMYGNTPVGTSKFYLARVPSSANGQVFNISLFDIGDGATSGSWIKVVPPAETDEQTFSGCLGKGVDEGALFDCQISVDGKFNGKWQTIAVPIPSGYNCHDHSLTGCWVRLEFYYGPESKPNDTTSWTASVEGDPIRLVE